MEGGGTIFQYETLGFLSAAPEPERASAAPPPSYSVLRSQITASVSEIPAVAPQDYFSLDGEAEVSSPGHIEPPTPCSPVREEEADPALETAWFRPNARFRSPMLQLHKEIVDFCDFMSPTQEEQASRASAVQSVISVVKYIWPECRVEVFGSYKTGLYLPTSDIDAVILESNVRSPQIGLQALKKALKQRGVAEKIQVIGRARVPIIKFVEKRSGVAFDISFDMTNGPEAADFIKDIVSKIPPLRPLCLILKVFLQQRELNEVYSGGIGSYALLTMLIAHLQIHWRGQDLKGRQSYMEQNLGILLVKFFELYGHKLNISDVGISCSSASTFFLKSARGFLNRERPSLLSIQDPQAPDNDIGKNSYNYFQIRSAFSTAYFWLTDAKRVLALGPNRSILGTIIRPDPLLLKRKGGYNGDVTFDRLLPGAGEPVEQLTGNGDFLGNWDLSDDEPLPRENGVADDLHIKSSRKARKMKKKQRNTSGQSSDGKKRKREENGRVKAKSGRSGKKFRD